MESSGIIGIIGIVASVLSPLVLGLLYTTRKISKSSCCCFNVDMQKDESNEPPIATVNK